MEQNSVPPGPSALEALFTRHRKELKDLQSRITQKKKNATKKTRRGVNEECERLERDLKEKHDRDVKEITGSPPEEEEDEEVQKVEGLTMQSTGPPNVAKQASPTAQLQSHKPNRARARLARRAAEMEAQMTAAAAEAANQPDRRTIELAALRERYKTLGLTEQNILPDGHCLYSAFADQLEWIGLPLDAALDQPLDGEQRKYRHTRMACADYLTKHKSSFEPFLDYDAGEDMDGHIAKVRDTAEWGGQMEVLALAKAYGVVANVVQAEGELIRMGEGEDEGYGSGVGKKQEVWLAYYRHSFGLGEHYNSLRAKR
ncbi:cysteine proteinase [Terfezia boudieri ATCC MYA-4762]|uniref:Cysteine proteinase n=1 Tax=Terfezia boudieri ATCC MYA-4762 TaxID=1051890 RepID=A0A3N4LNU8_9PEZI|nr:cysteine proteinase [Terfezia boudieri ATCC MYA-4762]